MGRFNAYFTYFIGAELVSVFIENLNVTLVDGVPGWDRIADRYAVWNEELGEGSRLGRSHCILKDRSGVRPISE
jgi:hypothetical protein